MNNQKHTPGPWVYPRLGTQVLTGDSWSTICVLHSGHGDKFQDHRFAEWKDGRGAEEAGANARLIAAAPELLDALKGMLKLWRDIGGDESNYFLSQTKAAISKAEGDAP